MDELSQLKTIVETSKKVLPQTTEAVDGICSTLLGLFDNVVLYPIKKANMTFRYKIEMFKDDMEKRMSNIPSENIHSPNLMIAGPTLEALKYTLDVESLRRMYINLLTSSMDSSKDNLAHPAFVEIIKQMSPLDAKALEFIQQNGRTAIACCNIRWQRKDTPKWDGFNLIKLERPGCFLYRHLVKAYEDGYSERDITVSFENLHRLGLIQIHDDMEVSRELYRDFESCEIVLKYQEEMSNRSDSSEYEVAILPVAVEITQLGLAFSDICLSDV